MVQVAGCALAPGVRPGGRGGWLAGIVLTVAILSWGTAHGAQTHEADPEADPVATHLERGQACLDQGDYAQAVLEFEQVLRFDNLPADLRQRTEIYAEVASGYREGRKRRSPMKRVHSGYGLGDELHAQCSANARHGVEPGLSLRP
jgi:hypothetical protein